MRAKIGIDEVGRGCLAGPVTVCAVLITPEFSIPEELPELRDSKKMTVLQREAWYRWTRDTGEEKGVRYAVSSVSAAMVDKLNIARASSLAAWRSFEKLMELSDAGKNLQVVLDGSLFLKNKDFQNSGALEGIEIKTVVGADSKFTEVKLASVLAKVVRDNYMRKMAEEYADYGFEKHKGYGTRDHIEAIRSKGKIEGFHRSSFLKNINFC
ncbi:MAG: ribonuclease HII [Candidatus Colwellbacteria bacterium]|jgi:ribonuclease HII|nr:ribonuclease HII [Candidatus Colwellbacteria bacterium]MDD3752616.1 ribonuclease HII [Candidatus Colwellbacteria bacterium]